MRLVRAAGGAARYIGHFSTISRERTEEREAAAALVVRTEIAR